MPLLPCRTMRRAAMTLAASASAVVWLLVLALWIRSFWVADVFRWTNIRLDEFSLTTVEIISNRGRLVLDRSGDRSEAVVRGELEDVAFGHSFRWMSRGGITPKYSWHSSEAWRISFANHKTHDASGWVCLGASSPGHCICRHPAAAVVHSPRARSAPPKADRRGTVRGLWVRPSRQFGSVSGVRPDVRNTSR
jgi:hypothetical protein